MTHLQSDYTNLPLMVSGFRREFHVLVLVELDVFPSGLRQYHLAGVVVVEPIVLLNEVESNDLHDVLNPPPHDTVNPYVERQSVRLKLKFNFFNSINKIQTNKQYLLTLALPRPKA